MFHFSFKGLLQSPVFSLADDPSHLGKWAKGTKPHPQSVGHKSTHAWVEFSLPQDIMWVTDIRLAKVLMVAKFSGEGFQNSVICGRI